MGRRRALAPLLVLIPALGCASFSYERADAPPPHFEQSARLRLGVVRFSQPDAAGFYPIRFSNTLADPIGDLSRAVAGRLRGSGRFVDVVYLGDPPPGAEEKDYYREVYQLDALLAGEVTRFAVSSVPELWSLVPPLIVLWPLHVVGLPTAPCHDSVVLQCSWRVEGLASGAGSWRSAELGFAWHERNWYSSLSIPATERAVQVRALDHFVTSLAGSVLSELSGVRIDALFPPAR